MSTQTFSRLFLCAFAAVGLLLAGCDSGGSNSDSPEWTGDWKFVQGFDGETPDPSFYITYTEDFSKAYINTQKGCEVTYSEVIDIEGETVTFAIPETGSIPGQDPIPGTNVRTEELTVSNDTLILEVTRSNIADTVAREGETSKAVPAEGDPRSILGCEKSAAVTNDHKAYRGLR